MVIFLSPVLAALVLQCTKNSNCNLLLMYCRKWCLSGVQIPAGGEKQDLNQTRSPTSFHSLPQSEAVTFALFWSAMFLSCSLHTHRTTMSQLMSTSFGLLSAEILSRCRLYPCYFVWDLLQHMFVKCYMIHHKGEAPQGQLPLRELRSWARILPSGYWLKYFQRHFCRT